jgi:alanyl-tRNA synthetase
MESNEVRKRFFEFFQSKQHKIVPSAPMVVKNDPTLMFTNAGMNQFKDVFLGNAAASVHRIANTQKCLRVSGKHNDLDEVGHDTYHHTMFEMLGNWSFGNYFKKEAIAWAWELLTEVYKISKENLYVTVFEGDPEHGMKEDAEAFSHWQEFVPAERILYGSKKDNFWEMGDTGPCGPCSEVHIDLRNEEDKKRVPGRDLVNKDHPEVIEVWNLVFIEFNRRSDQSLEPLPAKHVDTGMGFERLCMVLQGKTSNYDTDLFQDIIREIEKISGFRYGSDAKTDIAMRVVADHLRAVAFSIADGQLPSNIKAGYVIRRILRRAVRYGYTFLDRKEPFIYLLMPALEKKLGDVFPEIKAQSDLITNVIREEESTFLRTLEQGIRKFEQYQEQHPENSEIDGNFAFELFDTYGFPLDLTRIMAKEKGKQVDVEGFYVGLEKQRNRSRKAAEKTEGDWIVLDDSIRDTEFVGYESTTATVQIARYRKIKSAKKEVWQVVLDRTPFYAESGGQVGDRGTLENDKHRIGIIDTQKENELIIHLVEELPEDAGGEYRAVVDPEKRLLTMNNHSATHLMHAALKNVLGDHVEQKGSLVDENRLRFDFSHFSRVTEEEIQKIEKIVNARIRANIPMDEKREVPMQKALEMGAVALFGEKYGDQVRVITFDPEYSVELCGGTHVPATGQIGFFKIVSEGAIAAGIRRVEAITAAKAEAFIHQQEDTIRALKDVFKNQKDIVQAVNQMLEENTALKKEMESMKTEKAMNLKSGLLDKRQAIGPVQFIGAKVDLDMGSVRDLVHAMNRETDDLAVLLASETNGKVNLTLLISESLVKDQGLNAGAMIREIAREIGGGGGGQPHFATAGGKNAQGIDNAIQKTRELIRQQVSARE